MGNSSKEAKRQWRQNNPDKVAAYNLLRKARKAVMSDEELAAYRENRKKYNKDYRAKKRDDPEFRAKRKLAARKYYRLKHGIPLDAPFIGPKRKYATDEERRDAVNAAKRRSYAKKHGLTLEEIAARTAARVLARAERDRLGKTETPEQAQQRRAEAAAKKARAAKAKAAGLKELPPAKAQMPVNTNDPPELIALFAKAAKGQPPMPYNPKVKKISVFQFRGMR